MKANELISILRPTLLIGQEDREFSSLSSNSKDIKSGTLFFALKGVSQDGHKYIPEAIILGASVIICEEIPEKIETHCTYIQVPNSREAVALVSHFFYGSPSKKINIVGVTGTNGKTTIATLLFNLFTDLGYRCGLLSTINNRINDTVISATHTTPDPISLNALLAKMHKENCTYCFMEVSSHSIDQQRIAGLQFAGGIFTNITRDHLDYHLTFDNYLRVKKSFFDELPSQSFALSNADDKNGKVVLQNTKAKKYTYSTKGVADFRARIIESRLDGTLIEIDGKELWINMTGTYNVQNILAVTFTAFLLNQDMDSILISLSKLKPVSGRLETFIDSRNITAIVDYAHTPDALRKVLESVSSIIKRDQKIISVIGAGGNRDKGKRPLMTAEALMKSEQVILTDDNPRDEDPSNIIKDMMEGISSENKKKILIIEDREQAIRTAYALCKSGDIFIVAGKGHEQYQEICGVKHHFSDQEIIKELFDNK